MVIFVFVMPLEIDTLVFLCRIRNVLTGLPKGFYHVNNNCKGPFFVSCIFLGEGKLVYAWEEWTAQAAIPAFQFLSVCDTSAGKSCLWQNPGFAKLVDSLSIAIIGYMVVLQ